MQWDKSENKKKEEKKKIYIGIENTVASVYRPNVCRKYLGFLLKNKGNWFRSTAFEIYVPKKV